MVDERDSLAARFEANRSHLRSVAYRMLGSRSEAEDAVQEAWLKLSRADADSVENLGGFLTTVVARVCLDMLRARKARREDSIETHAPDAVDSRADAHNLEHEAILSDSVGLALLVVLDALTPAERVAFVLHDMFDLPFDDIARIVGRSPAAARQLASRARRRVQGAPANAAVDRARQRHVVDAFLAASRSGNFEALLAVLDPNVVLRADPVLVEHARANPERGAAPIENEMHGAAAVAKTFQGRAKNARPALIDGDVGLVVALGGTPRVAFAFVIEGEKIAEIDIIGELERMAALNIELLQDLG